MWETLFLKYFVCLETKQDKVNLNFCDEDVSLKHYTRGPIKMFFPYIFSTEFIENSLNLVYLTNTIFLLAKTNRRQIQRLYINSAEKNILIFGGE